MFDSFLCEIHSDEYAYFYEWLLEVDEEESDEEKD